MMNDAFWSKTILTASLSFLMAVPLLARGQVAGATSPVLRMNFIFEQAPFRSCHASTIVETRDGLLAAWFGGSEEGARDVVIWMAAHDGKAWSQPVEVANGIDEQNRIQYPCWNPVLFQPSKGPLLLFYKVGPSPSKWWGMLKTSENNGRAWSSAKRLPNDIYGPIRSKPVELNDNLILCPSSTEDAGWRVHMEWTRSFGQQWSRTSALNSAMEYGAIQPTILVWPSRQIQILCRTKQRRITEAWSDNNFQSWSRMVSTSLPNPNSGFDALMLRDGRALLVYNHTQQGRGLLNIATSKDGKRWHAGWVLENEPGSEFSYPAVIQTNDGLVNITYTWKRERIKHVVIDPFKLESGSEIVEGRWPD